MRHLWIPDMTGCRPFFNLSHVFIAVVERIFSDSGLCPLWNPAGEVYGYSSPSGCVDGATRKAQPSGLTPRFNERMCGLEYCCFLCFQVQKSAIFFDAFSWGFIWRRIKGDKHDAWWAVWSHLCTFGTTSIRDRKLRMFQNECLDADNLTEAAQKRSKAVVPTIL